MRNGWAALLSVPRLQRVRVKGNEMRGKGEGEGAKEVGSVEGGGPHLVKARSRRVVEHTLTYHESGGEGGLGRAVHSVLALTRIITDVNTVGQN